MILVFDTVEMQKIHIIVRVLCGDYGSRPMGLACSSCALLSKPDTVNLLSHHIHLKGLASSVSSSLSSQYQVANTVPTVHPTVKISAGGNNLFHTEYNQNNTTNHLDNSTKIQTNLDTTCHECRRAIQPER